MEDQIKIGCVIMASGASTRFGSNKLLAPFNGVPLVENTIRKVVGLFSPIVVVTRYADVARIAESYQAVGVTTVTHAFVHRSDTIRLGIEAMGDIDGICFMVADQPLFSRGTLSRMIKSFLKWKVAIVRPSFMGMAGNPVIYPRPLLPELASLPEGGCGRDVVAKHQRRVWLVEVGYLLELRDADTPEALAALERESDIYTDI